MKKYILLALFLIAGINANSQYFSNRNKQWVFGSNAGVSFTSGSPVSYPTGLVTSEGSASVGDVASGALLFYTDGKSIWNNTGALMPGAASIVPFSTSSSTQGALIVTSISDPNQYYVFSMEEVGSGAGDCHLAYTLVDMTLDAGLGDVVPGVVGIPMASDMGEKLTAIPGANCNIWIITHHRDSTKFYAYEMTATGLSLTPVMSTVGSITSYGAFGAYCIGVIKASPNNLKIVSQSYNPGSPGAVGTELYDFDPATGIVYNCIKLDSLNDEYGAEFSPDNTKLYTSDVSGGCTISQYDISLPTAAAMRASRTTVATGSGYPQLDLGPDGKVYLPSLAGFTNLDCFSTPNNPGVGCGFTAGAVPLAPGRPNYGMPNLVVSTQRYTHHDSLLCIDTAAGATITIYPHSTGSSYIWSDGSTSSSLGGVAYGSYWVAIYNTGLCTEIDSITVIGGPTDTTTSRRDTTVCELVPTITLRAPAGTFTAYEWEDGSTGATHIVTDSGTYRVNAIRGCELFSDTIRVNYIAADTTINVLLDDTLCITAAPLLLTAPAGASGYLWSTGGTTPTITVSATGTYWSHALRNTGGGCAAEIDTFHVNFAPIPTVNIGNDTAFCVGNTLTMTSIQPAGSTYLWNTGSTGPSESTSVSGTFWLYVTNANGQGCAYTDTIHVLISPRPLVDLGNDTINCNGTAFPLQSSITYTAPSYFWNTGNTTPSITVTSSGLYWLQVTEGGCTGIDSINVDVFHDTFTLYNVDTAICKGQSVKGMVTANPLATLQWVPTAGIALSTMANTLITPDTSAMYYIRVSMASCPVKTDSFYLEVQPNPIVYIGGNRAICQFDTLHIHATVEPKWYTQYAYSWDPLVSVDDATKMDIVFTAGDSTNMILTVTTPAGCRGMDSALLIVHPGNFATISNDTNICPRDSVQLIAEGGTTYNWHPGIYLSDSTTGAPWVHAITSQHYTVIASSAYDCKDTLHASITVRAGAVLFLGDSVTLHPGESYQINPQTNCTNFLWFPPAGLDYIYAPNPVATPQISTRYIVNGSTEWGCVAKDSIVIRIDEETQLGIPNAFAPGNGPNGKFYVLREGNAILNHFRIYNRWGNIVFETTNINEGWDGTYNDKPQPFGVYVYELEATTPNGQTIRKQGNVTLIR